MKRITQSLLMLALVIAVSTPVLALNAVDKDGKVIGEALGQDNGFGELTVARKQGAALYLIIVGRPGIRGTQSAYYTSGNCTGPVYILMDPEDRIPIIAFPSALGADGRMFIMQRKTMSQVNVRSYYDTYLGECTTVGSRDNRVWVTPTQPVGNLGTTFLPPYQAR